ncbi:hypothetical protein AAFC00_004592 [Neodothiora populina]|uniref:Nudix hydrolase domain-containing protein n=1 Tax=Neodothiora populina TaxID=2781224 RepID=A0ABR3P2V1_9PEZI
MSSSSLPHNNKPHKPSHPHSSAPVYANFASENLTIGAGVATFHLASERVVLCWHSRDGYWFLPKGRRNASEEAGCAAVREGFEESGYRNRLLPLPIPHRQPYPDELSPEAAIHSFDTEPLWTQLVPQSRSAQYILHWYVAETLCKDDEDALNLSSDLASSSLQTSGVDEKSASSDSGSRRRYIPPPRFPRNMTLRQRIALDSISSSVDGSESVYEPRKYEGTGVDEEELLYQSALVPVAEACRRLGGGVMSDVVRRGWEAVRLRMRIEDEREEGRKGTAVGGLET